MGWPPAVVIVVRHGARLDAADKQWHLTSPTPYDPPLTYGGWKQSTALGARIASLLRTRETDDEVPITNGSDTLGGGERRKRRHKVVIHSSPFLRCVQTSVAISAGLAQNPGHTIHRPSSAQSQTKMSQMHSSPRMRPTSSTESPILAPIPEPAVALNGKDSKDNIKKATVRVDAFLGEWLLPDYFEQITPPPSSIMMVASAKADLLRKEDYSSLIQITATSAQNVGFPGGWGSPVVAAKKDDDDEGPLSTLSSLAQALPRRDRTSSLSSLASSGSRHRGRSPNSLTIPAPEYGVYQPPVPHYAILSSDQIPSGYVAHARDACVDVDYQWDSMRDPQSWGNGGEYGEEWSTMHKRFRRGLGKMINWYKESDDPGKLLTKTSGPSHLSVNDEEVDEDTDLVLILVTHGAGCNALIGALTNQPVLLDVGMASLTMAVRIPTPANSPTSTPGATPKSHSRANSRNLSVSDQYDVKLVANTEHLRTSSSSTPTSSRAASIAGLPAFRERFNPVGGTDGAGYSIKSSRSGTPSGNFGSIRRAASIATPGPRGYVPTRQSSIGLWSAPAATPPEGDPVAPEDDMILNFGDENATESPLTDEKDDEEAIEKDRDEEDEVAPLGLWGSPRPPGVAEKIREIAPKRRWTVNERG